jgi:hypothetical protein
MTQLIFWGSLLLMFSAYFGYPLIFLVLSVFKERSVFLQVYLSILSAWYCYLLGGRIVSWHPAEQ